MSSVIFWLLICCICSGVTSSDVAPMVKTEGEAYLIGLFSICLDSRVGKPRDSLIKTNLVEGRNHDTMKNASRLNHTDQNIDDSGMPGVRQTNKLALWYYLNFETTVAAGNFMMAKYPDNTTIKFGTVSFDVCYDTKLLAKTALSLIVDQEYLYRVTAHSSYSKYIVIYSFMNERLTRLAAQLFSVLRIPFIALSDRPKRMLPRTIFPFYHQIGSQLHDAQSMKTFFDRFRWKSIAILALSGDRQSLARTGDLYQLLVKNGTFCVYKETALDLQNVHKAIELLRSNPRVRIVYAMGNAIDTKRFLDELARESILDRVLFIDISCYELLPILPESTLKGLFLVSGFITGYIPDYLKFKVCHNKWFHSYDARTGNKCLYNSTQLILRDQYSRETAHSMNLFNFAVMLPIMNSHHTGDSLDRHSVMQIASDRTHKYLTAGFYVININKQGAFRPFPISSPIDETTITWPGNLTKPPEASCENFRTVPPGFYQTFGAIPPDDTGWDSESGWTYQKCPSGTIKSEPGKDKCRRCPHLHRSDHNRTACFDPYTNESVVNLRTESGVFLSVFNILGILLSVVYLVCYAYYRATPVVKSSQFMLTMIQLSSHLAVFIFIMIGHTNNEESVTCSISSVAIGLSFSLNLGVTIVKTQMVVTIFAMRRKLSCRSKAKQKHTCGLIAALSVGCSILLSIVTIARRQPSVVSVLNHTELSRFTFCDFGEHIQVQFIYSLLLSFACATQSARARRLPEFFKSTRFIIYAMFTNLITMLVFFTLFHTQRENARRRAYVVAFAASISNASILTIVHSSRVYSIFDSRTNNTKFLRHHVQANLKKQNEIRLTDITA